MSRIALMVLLLPLVAAADMAAPMGPPLGTWVVSIPVDPVVIEPAGALVLQGGLGKWDAERASEIVITVEDFEGEPVEGAVVMYPNNHLIVWRPNAPLAPETQHFAMVEVNDTFGTPYSGGFFLVTSKADVGALKPAEITEIRSSAFCHDGCCTPNIVVEWRVASTGLPAQYQIVRIAPRWDESVWQNQGWVGSAASKSLSHLGTSAETAQEEYCADLVFESLLDGSTVSSEACVTHEDAFPQEADEPWCEPGQRDEPAIAAPLAADAAGCTVSRAASTGFGWPIALGLVLLAALVGPRSRGRAL